MSIYIVGSGSREQVIKEKLEKSNYVKNVTISNELPTDDLNLDMVVLGSEEAIVNGYKDNTNYFCFAPTKKAAQIEGCKIFAKQFMKKHDLPTSDFIVANNKYEAYKFIDNNFQEHNKYVIKLPGLEKGKGVFVPENKERALRSLEKIYGDNLQKKIIIEERLYGTEVSVMAFCNGTDIELMPQAMDYKRIYDDDQGPNTGGMGAIAPVDILNETELASLKKDMLKVVQELDFRGVLYAGIIKHDQGYSILEFNCRFGDPETQVILNLLDSDLYQIMKNCILGEKLDIRWNNKKAACLVLSHIIYPFSKLTKEIDVVIDNIKDVKLYPANLKNNRTTGGRVLSLVSVENDLSTCLENVYNQAPKINYKGKYYRRDIGLNFITQHNNKKNLKIAILGSTKGTSIQKLLANYKDLGVKIEIIISTKPSAILDKSKEKGITSLFIPYQRKNSDIFYDKLANIFMIYDIDLILCVGYMNIIPKYFCDKFRGKIFNIHPSLLPDYKKLHGIHVHEKVLSENNIFSGCTIHEINEEVDGGRIKLQKQCKINGITDVYKLKTKVQELESQALIDFIKIQQNKSLSYKDAGVDIDIGNEFVETIKDSNIGDFCGFFELDGRKIGACCDGVGTKLDIANKYNKLENIGIDLVAMCVNDLIVRGFRPKIFLDYIAQEKLDQEKLKVIIASIKKGCQIADCILLGGETAEMPNIYFNNGFDLAGFTVGVLDNQLYPKVEEITSGCYIYGIKSNGIHSNGYSLVRKLLKYHDYDIDTLLKPTKIYTECFDIMEKYGDELLGIAHITGGGLIDNILRIIPYNLQIKLDIKIKDEFLWIMEKGELTKNDMLKTYNCGYGIALIFRKGFEINEYDRIGEII